MGKTTGKASSRKKSITVLQNKIILGLLSV